MLSFFSYFGLMWVILPFLTFFYDRLSIVFLVLCIFFLLSVLLVRLLLEIHDLVLSDRGDFIQFNTFIADWYKCSMEFSLQLDFISLIYGILVLAIGQVTVLLAAVYLKNDFLVKKFIVLVFWFIMSMLLLVNSNSVLTLLMGWELIGVTSFLLINFWFQRKASLSCAFKAFIHNKISDGFLLIVCVCLVFISGTSNLTVLMENDELFWGYIPKLKLLVLLVILAANIKSAQLFTHLWLVDSMEAPTPASALIHSATLVSAGLYLLLRLQPIIFQFNLSVLIFYVGAATAVVCGITAASQTDMKKMLAYSTISHCGFLFVCFSFSNIILITSYLFLHGVFKASTFFCISHIMRIQNTQDLRSVGNFFSKSPISCLLLVNSVVNLGGLPFTCGYLYKQLLFTEIVSLPSGCMVWLVVGLLTSVVYTYKLIYFTCFDFTKGSLYLESSYLQLNKNKQKYQYHNNTSLVFSFSIVYLFVVGLLFAYFVEYFILKSALCLQFNSFVFTRDLKSSYYWNLLYGHYYQFYVSLVWVFVGVLILLSGRNTIFKNQHILLIGVVSYLCIFSISSQYISFNIKFIVNSVGYIVKLLQSVPIEVWLEAAPYFAIYI